MMWNLFRSDADILRSRIEKELAEAELNLLTAEDKVEMWMAQAARWETTRDRLRQHLRSLPSKGIQSILKGKS